MFLSGVEFSLFRMDVISLSLPLNILITDILADDIDLSTTPLSFISDRGIACSFLLASTNNLDCTKFVVTNPA